MKLSFPLFLISLFVGISFPVVAAEDKPVVSAAPLPRLRLTDTLRVKVEDAAQHTEATRAVTMEKVVVREKRLPNGPPKEKETEGKFTVTQGGYLLKKHGETFSTEVGLWRHIDIIEDPREALRQSDRIRMGVLRISW